LSVHKFLIKTEIGEKLERNFKTFTRPIGFNTKLSTKPEGALTVLAEGIFEQIVSVKADSNAIDDEFKENFNHDRKP